MKDYLVSVPDSTKVVESANFIAFNSPGQEIKLRRYEQGWLMQRLLNNLHEEDLAKCDAVKAAHRKAWELAKKIWNMTWTDRREAFGVDLYSLEDIAAYEYDYIAEKYAAWEQKKAEEAARKIEVGEIWESRHSKIVVLNVTDYVVSVMSAGGRRFGLSRLTFCDIYTKTEKKIDVNAIDFLNSFEEV